MSGFISNTSFTTNRFVGLVNERISGFPVKEKQYLNLGYQIEKSNNAQEIKVIDDMLTLAGIKPEGAAGMYSAVQERFKRTTVHVMLQHGIQISQEALQDGKGMNILNTYAPQIVDSIERSKEILAVQPFNNGYSNTCWDGTPILGTSHPLVQGGTQSNILPTAATLSKTAVQDLVLQIMTAKNINGVYAAVLPETLIIHPNNIYIAEEITKSYFNPENANNTVNPVVTMGLLPKGYVTNIYLDNSANWFIKTNRKAGLVHFERTGIETRSEPKMDELIEKHIAFQRISFDIYDYLALFGSGNN